MYAIRAIWYIFNNKIYEKLMRRKRNNHLWNLQLQIVFVFEHIAMNKNEWIHFWCFANRILINYAIRKFHEVIRHIMALSLSLARSICFHRFISIWSFERYFFVCFCCWHCFARFHITFISAYFIFLHTLVYTLYMCVPFIITR